jgi:CHAD domain-containing protein
MVIGIGPPLCSLIPADKKEIFGYHTIIDEMRGDSDDQELARKRSQYNIAGYPFNTPELLKRSDSSHHPHAGYAMGRIERLPYRTTCTFAAQQILPLLEKFSREIEGVKNGNDIEYLHRMRVASRRIRAALRIFRFCFPQKQYPKYTSDMRNITRALAQARDADVQIASLKKARKRLSAALQDIPDEGQAHSVKTRLEAIQYLVVMLRRERAGYQKNVFQSLEKFERQKQPEVIRGSVLTSSAAIGQRRHKSRNHSTMTILSAENIGQGIIELHTYESWLKHPDAITEHHAMRIAAKHLRYTMEIFAPLYRLGLKKYIARVTRLQQLLGDLHDTDVWIDRVTLMLLKERSRPRVLDDPHRPGPGVVSGLKLFLQDTEKERVKLFKRTVQYWNLLQRTNFWEDLKREISINAKIRYVMQPEMPEEVRKDLICRYSQVYPQGVAHSRHVAHLSLQLFDQLQVVHHLAKRERGLLEYGALLHDVGWKFGKKGHAKQSAVMIYSEEHLPLTMEERGIIGLLAYSHRGKSRFEKSGYFGLLPPEQQEIIRLLAGILRVADGLDRLHRTRVRSLQCNVAPDTVICTILASSDCSEEISIAKEKAAILEQALGKKLQFIQEIPELSFSGVLPGTVSLEKE